MGGEDIVVPGTAEWWVVTTAISLAIGIIGYFLKRTMSKVDEHDKDINVIKQTYVTNDELKEARSDAKDSVKELRTEIKAELAKISSDMSDIKEKSLSKQDFYRAQSETNENIKRIYDLLIKLNGGGHLGE